MASNGRLGNGTSAKIRSPVAEWYTGKSVFITGGSGFMGKVLIEKLLFSCEGIDKIYILMREKRGKSATQRIEEMWKLPLFGRLRSKSPMSIKKVVPLNGDLNSPQLGLGPADLAQLKHKVQVFFHCGATLKLEASLKEAIEQNTAGTARAVDVAKQMNDLKGFVHFSTAFCSADLDVFEEKVYDCKDHPREVMDVVNWMKPADALDVVTPSIIAPHPNTYTYSKRLAEKLVAEESKNIPVCIVRPSIVTPAAFEPLPGWVDSLNGPMGLMVGAGKGVIRSMHVIAETKAQVVPVDIAINASIIIAQKLASSTYRPGPHNTLDKVPVYNLTQDEVVPTTMGTILDRGRSLMYENPFEGQIWYPDGDIRASRLVHNIYCVFLHWIPALFIDFLLLIFFQKRFMVRLQTRIHNGLELLQFFTTRQWIFRSSNFLNLAKEVTAEDNKVFSTDLTALPMDDYMKVCILGARQYLMKEDLSSLPRCRVKQNILFVVHKLFIYSLYMWLLWSLVSYFPAIVSLVASLFSFFSGLCSHLPIVGSLISK